MLADTPPEPMSSDAQVAEQNNSADLPVGEPKRGRKPTEDDLAIALRMKARREALQMSQAELGRMIGVSYQQIQKYESGTNRIAIVRLTEAARVLQCPVEYLVSGGDLSTSQNEMTDNEMHEFLLSSEVGMDLLRALASVKDVGKREMFLRKVLELAALIT